MSTANDPSNAQQFLEKMFRLNHIVLVSATYCQFSTKVKARLVELKQRFVSLEIDVLPNGREVFRSIVAMTGIHTVPQVFVDGEYIGGYDEVIALQRKGELMRVLAKRRIHSLGEQRWMDAMRTTETSANGVAPGHLANPRTLSSRPHNDPYSRSYMVDDVDTYLRSFRDTSRSSSSPESPPANDSFGISTSATFREANDILNHWSEASYRDDDSQLKSKMESTADTNAPSGSSPRSAPGSQSSTTNSHNRRYSNYPARTQRQLDLASFRAVPQPPASPSRTTMNPQRVLSSGAHQGNTMSSDALGSSSNVPHEARSYVWRDREREPLTVPNRPRRRSTRHEPRSLRSMRGELHHSLLYNPPDDDTHKSFHSANASDHNYWSSVRARMSRWLHMSTPKPAATSTARRHTYSRESSFFEPLVTREKGGGNDDDEDDEGADSHRWSQDMDDSMHVPRSEYDIDFSASKADLSGASTLHIPHHHHPHHDHDEGARDSETPPSHAALDLMPSSSQLNQHSLLGIDGPTGASAFQTLYNNATVYDRSLSTPLATGHQPSKSAHGTELPQVDAPSIYQGNTVEPSQAMYATANPPSSFVARDEELPLTLPAFDSTDHSSSNALSSNSIWGSFDNPIASFIDAREASLRDRGDEPEPTKSDSGDGKPRSGGYRERITGDKYAAAPSFMLSASLPQAKRSAPSGGSSVVVPPSAPTASTAAATQAPGPSARRPANGPTSEPVDYRQYASSASGVSSPISSSSPWYLPPRSRPAVMANGQPLPRLQPPPRPYIPQPRVSRTGFNPHTAHPRPLQPVRLPANILGLSMSNSSPVHDGTSTFASAPSTPRGASAVGAQNHLHYQQPSSPRGSRTTEGRAAPPQRSENSSDSLTYLPRQDSRNLHDVYVTHAGPRAETSPKLKNEVLSPTHRRWFAFVELEIPFVASPQLTPSTSPLRSG